MSQCCPECNEIFRWSFNGVNYDVPLIPICNPIHEMCWHRYVIFWLICCTPSNNTTHFNVYKKDRYCFDKWKTTTEVKQPSNTYSLLDKIPRSKTVFGNEYILSTMADVRIFLFPTQIIFVFLNISRRLLLYYSFYSVELQFNKYNVYLKRFSRSKRGTIIAKQKCLQFLMVCVALWRHFTSAGSKNDAAFLTNSQDVFLCLKRKL